MCRQIELKMILNNNFKSDYLKFMIMNADVSDIDYETDEGCDIVFFVDSSDEEN